MQSSINSRKSPITCPNNNSNGAVTVKNRFLSADKRSERLCLHTMRGVCIQLQQTNNYLNDISDSNLTENQTFVGSYRFSSTMCVSKPNGANCCTKPIHSLILIIIMM
ncbi:hypothetical protein ATANTOWER_001026 [Ataeniobius toweri]|uniref:Uncharacterized protein n=1 Tax=Ataeniobius toweri TaxID=208326 RepID=A0ABU7A4V2_9TELE|nr:hypothetical protein [Ataeniobius toweri]